MPLVGYWPLNESSGSTAYDYSGQGNDGTVNNGGDSTVVAGSSFVGQNAYSFDGSNDWVDIGTSALSASTDFTIFAWVKITSDASGMVVQLQDQNDVRFGYEVGSIADNEFGARLYDGSSNIVSTADFSLNSWEQVAVKYDGSSAFLYLNGAKKGSVSSGQPSQFDNGFSVGGNFDGTSDFLTGSISEVRIYNHSLTRKEIQYLYEAGRRGRFVSSKKRVRS